jgi:damage-control phosphatase, subfamily I
MKSCFDCAPCFVRQTLDATKKIKLNNNEKMIENTLRRVLKAIAVFDFELSPPHMAQIIHRIIREETGDDDPYRQIKNKSTRTAKSLEHSIRARIQKSNDHFETAVRFSIAGNILDFAFSSTWNAERINDSFDKAEKQSLDRNMVQKLKHDLEQENSVLVLGDNAGETVFDRLLIEQFPTVKKVRYAVKSAPVINDATLQDALDAGLNEVAELIPNGTDAPGTILSQCSDAFKQCFYESDLVIAKGQANFETLNDADRDIFFLTQIKCPVIAQRYCFELGQWIISTNARSSLNKPLSLSGGDK